MQRKFRPEEAGWPTVAFIMVHLEFDTSSQVSRIHVPHISEDGPLYPGQLVVHLSLHCRAPACLSFLPMETWMLMEKRCSCDLCERLWEFLNVVFI